MNPIIYLSAKHHGTSQESTGTSGRVLTEATGK